MKRRCSQLLSEHVPHEHAVVAPVAIEPGGDELWKRGVPGERKADALLARHKLAHLERCGHSPTQSR